MNVAQFPYRYKFNTKQNNGQRMWQRKFTCELSSEVIKSLHLEYDVDLDKAQEEVNKIVPIATVNNFGAYIRTHGVPQDLGVDAEVAEMIVDAVKIIQ